MQQTNVQQTCLGGLERECVVSARFPDADDCPSNRLHGRCFSFPPLLSGDLLPCFPYFFNFISPSLLLPCWVRWFEEGKGVAALHGARQGEEEAEDSQMRGWEISFYWRNTFLAAVDPSFRLIGHVSMLP